MGLKVLSEEGGEDVGRGLREGTIISKLDGNQRGLMIGYDWGTLQVRVEVVS